VIAQSPGNQRVGESRHHYIATRSPLCRLSHHGLGEPDEPWRLVGIRRHVNAGRKPNDRGMVLICKEEDPADDPGDRAAFAEDRFHLGRALRELER